ncbi:SGT1-domain-containing protein [Teratosphaeria nubilosa]|uniref:SGT1-domain-containing protein n=1 Tax=Teratosphaeria nubilosa TaxID=161662 RepID=A0A6G1KYR5_9PEZI|nr:SGT1-domain-containing protein [Teratosphaeria nubilosa]
MDGDIAPGDGLKWFGEGFDGFPKRLPDDCVEYIVYAVDQKLQSNAAVRTRLNQIAKKANDLVKQHANDYIWQRDAFDLSVFPDVTKQDASQQEPSRTPYLKGRTNFGDSVADEWLIVFMLSELSKQCPDAWIRVCDTDGEFLLIEAASNLPKWLNPDVAENRVWINNGHLRIIPLDDEFTTRNLSTQDALDFIKRKSDKLIINPFVEDEAFYRIRDYPGAIASTFYHALVTIPRRLAYILKVKPAYISPAVETFYLRDPISLKPLATKDLSALKFPPEDLVTVSVRFTKVGYAQLRSQLFDTPPAWTGIIPRLSDPKVEMGMKITCGFEMLLADPQNQDKREVREMQLLLEDVENGDETLPSDKELEAWPKTQDDDKWLDVDYNDFEQELSGKKAAGQKGKGKGFGDKGAEENLRKMVSRFEDFLNDDDAGAEGVDDDDVDDSEPEEEDSGEDNDASFDEAEFERAMKEMMGMPSDQIEKTGLLEEARKLALEDEKSGDAPDEDEEMRKIMDLMEKELKGHDALNLNNPKPPKSSATSSKKVYFGPERPPGMQQEKTLTTKGKGRMDIEEDEDVGPGYEELSSDDEEFNDVDLGLARNMLEAFKGQAGMAGPAGNLMRALGVGMPRDEGEEKD